MKYIDHSSTSTDSDYSYGIREYCYENDNFESNVLNITKENMIAINKIFDNSKATISLKVDKSHLRFSKYNK